MISRISKAISLMSLVVALPLWAGQGEHHHPTPKPIAEFDALRPLVGEWEGVTKTEKGEETVRASYELISSGMAIMERHFIGTPNEMVTVYHREGTRLAATHYCAVGNAPRLALQRFNNGVWTFDLAKQHGLASTKENHIHALTLSFDGANQLTQEWTSFENGKKKDTLTVRLTRRQNKA